MDIRSPADLFLLQQMGATVLGLNSLGAGGVMSGGQNTPTRSYGYKLGDQKIFTADARNEVLVEYPSADKYCRWKLVLNVEEDPADPLPAAPYGSGVTFTIYATVENDVIESRVRVGVGNTEIRYLQGTKIRVEASNPETVHNLKVNYSLDEYATGLSVWRDFDVVNNPAGVVANLVEYPIEVPNYARSMVLICNSSNQFTLRAYIQGTEVWEENFNGPRTTEIPLIPGADYTVQKNDGVVPANVIMLFGCVG